MKPKFDGQRLLVVDDDPGIRKTLKLQLGRGGLDVTTAGSAEEALNLFGSVDPDLVVTDVKLPGMQGLELLRRLLASRPNLPVVVITGHGGMEPAIAAMKEGARDYLTKPLDLNQVEAVVERNLGHRDVRAVPAEPAHGDRTVLVGSSPGMIMVFKSIGTLARSRSPVLLRGETGTGKDLVARAIHENSGYSERPFVALNCSSLPGPLLSSELFGHVRGAFTGAVESRRGAFAQAGAGTVFLDEIGDTSLDFQAALLRVLDGGAFQALGDDTPRKLEARVIAATHRPLEQWVAEGRFREDLYFRLRAVEVRLPPLRDRPDDIPALARSLLPHVAREAGVAVPDVSAAVFDGLRAHAWPGNVRELRQALLRGAVASRGGPLVLADLALGTTNIQEGCSDPDERLSAAIERHVTSVLAKSYGNKRRAARRLEISRSRLDRILRSDEERASDRAEGDE